MKPLNLSPENRASPCVPNAGILHPPHERSGSVLCYDVPPTWWYVDPDDVKSFADNLGELE